MTPMATTVSVLVEHVEGAPVCEELRVEPCGGSRYRLLQSPGFVLGMAADDLFDLREDKTFSIVKRGDNLCIQIFADDSLNELERATSLAFSKIGGRLDGRMPKLLVYTASVNVGFPAIESILNDLSSRFPNMHWYYGNVYDPNDGTTPLNWW